MSPHYSKLCSSDNPKVVALSADFNFMKPALSNNCQRPSDTSRRKTLLSNERCTAYASPNRICCGNHFSTAELEFMSYDAFEHDDFDYAWPNHLNTCHFIKDTVLSAFEVHALNANKRKPYVRNPFSRFKKSKSYDGVAQLEISSDDEAEVFHPHAYTFSTDVPLEYSFPYLKNCTEGVEIESRYYDFVSTKKSAAPASLSGVPNGIEPSKFICPTESSDNSVPANKETFAFSGVESCVNKKNNFGSVYDGGLLPRSIPVVLAVLNPLNLSPTLTNSEIFKIQRRCSRQNHKRLASSKNDLYSYEDKPREPSIQTPVDLIPLNETDRTTVMLRNIPNKYTQQMLLEVIDEQYKQLYDFFYLPIDFRNKCNVGYAFINFIKPKYAIEFKKEYEGFKLAGFKSSKICKVSWGRVQGLEANIQHYKNSAVMSLSNFQHKPMILKKGIPISFPVADYPLPEIKLRPQKKIKFWSLKR